MHNPKIKSKGVIMSTSNCPNNYISSIQIQVATLVNNYKRLYGSLLPKGLSILYGYVSSKGVSIVIITKPNIDPTKRLIHWFN